MSACAWVLGVQREPKRIQCLFCFALLQVPGPCLPRRGADAEEAAARPPLLILLAGLSWGGVLLAVHVLGGAEGTKARPAPLPRGGCDCVRAPCARGKATGPRSANAPQASFIWRWGWADPGRLAGLERPRRGASGRAGRRGCCWAAGRGPGRCRDGYSGLPAGCGVQRVQVL